eukprot:COSAG02_NODE_10496_length_1929_cov_1.284153_2_plen_234_part_00
MGVVAPQEEKKQHAERKQQIIEEKKQYVEKQKQVQKQSKAKETPKPQFVAAKASSSQEAMSAHLPPHLAELVKKQGTDGKGRVDYKVNTKRSQTGKTQLQKELDAKKAEAAQQEKQMVDAKKGFLDPTAKTGEQTTRFAKVAKLDEGVGPGKLEGIHAEVPNLMDEEEGARLAAAGRPKLASRSLERTVSTAAPGRNLQEGIGVTAASDMDMTNPPHSKHPPRQMSSLSGVGL